MVSMAPNEKSRAPWTRTLGIVGGLGPHAHLELERRLLKAVEPVAGEQEYPSWILASLPSTPDRTMALLEGGPSPVPAIVRSLEALAAGADFAVIACVTAHAFIDELRRASPLPILSLVDATLDAVVRRWGRDARVGVLATTGTLRSAVFPLAAERLAPELTFVSLLDLPDGERLQEDWVMTPIYGPLEDGRSAPWGAGGETCRTGGRLKAGVRLDPQTREALDEPLRRAAQRLAAAGARVVLTACTEIGMTLGSGSQGDFDLLDPLDAAVEAALAVCCARTDIPRGPISQ
jgi:aspartate racemase